MKKKLEPQSEFVEKHISLPRDMFYRIRTEALDQGRTFSEQLRRLVLKGEQAG